MSKRNIISEITIGADPECFIYDTKTNRVKSAIKLIPGTKENPFNIEEFGQGFAVQTDNILAEFNIPPVDNINDFVDNITTMKNYISSKVKAINENYDILCEASQNIHKSELRSKQAKEFGCDPDYCVYTGDVNPKPVNAATTTIRSAGFHIHIGYSNPNINTSLLLVKYLDAYLGIPSVLIDHDVDRRTLYGKAGCFRLTKYGVEYRTLSSYFLRDKQHLEWVYNQVIKAIHAFNNHMDIPYENDVKSAINENNVDLAKKLCTCYSLCNDFLNN